MSLIHHKWLTIIRMSRQPYLRMRIEFVLLISKVIILQIQHLLKYQQDWIHWITKTKLNILNSQSLIKNRANVKQLISLGNRRYLNSLSREQAKHLISIRFSPKITNLPLIIFNLNLKSMIKIAKDIYENTPRFLSESQHILLKRIRKWSLIFLISINMNQNYEKIIDQTNQ